MKNIKEGFIDMDDRMRQSNKCLIDISEGKNGKEIFEKIMVDNFPKLMKYINLQI